MLNHDLRSYGQLLSLLKYNLNHEKLRKTTTEKQQYILYALFEIL